MGYICPTCNSSTTSKFEGEFTCHNCGAMGPLDASVETVEAPDVEVADVDVLADEDVEVTG